MSARHVLQLDASRATVWLWHRGTLKKDADFSSDAAGVAAFAEYLSRNPDSHFAIVTDVAEEGYHAESVPFVRGGSRKALLQRKLDQTFHGSQLSLFHSLGRDAAGRRDERVLLLGLRQAEFFQPWLATLRQHGATLSGLYSPPLLASRLLGRLDSPRLLLLTLGRAGVRVTFFENGRLRFSHLAQIPGNSPEEIAAAAAQEAKRLVQYLLGQRLAIRDASLPCLILTHPDHLGAFADACTDTAELEFRLEDLAAIAHKAGLKEAPPDSLADSLMLHLALAKPPREHFAPPSELRLHRLWQQRRLALGSGAAFLVLALLVLAGQAWWAGEFFSRARALEDEAGTLNKQYRARIAALPPLPTLPEHLKRLNLAYRELERHSPRPLDALLLIAAALDEFPDVNLSRLEWEVTGEERARPPGQKENAADTSVAATLNATLPKGSGLRQQLETADAFAAALARDPRYTVTLLKRPLNVEPGKFLRGGDSEDGAQPEFALRIQRRL